jgi:YVTN family beta-propeller protein
LKKLRQIRTLLVIGTLLGAVCSSSFIRLGIQLGAFTHEAFATGNMTTNSLMSIKVGSSPSGMAINPNTNLLYITNFGSDYISVINDNTNQVITSIKIEKGLWGVDINPNTNKIYVTSVASQSLYVIDGNTNTLIEKITGVGNGPYQVAVNPSTNKIYVSDWNYPDGGYTVVNGTDNKIIKRVTGLGGSSFGIAVNANTNRIYINNFNPEKDKANTVSVIDGLTDKLIDKIAIGYGRGNASSNSSSVRVVPIVVDMHDNTIYAQFKKSAYIAGNVSDLIQSLYAINGTNNRIIASLPLSAEALAVDSNLGLVYAYAAKFNFTDAGVLYTKYSIVIFNSAGNKLMDFMNIQNGSEAHAIALDQKTHSLYIAEQSPSDSISIITQAEIAPEFNSSIPLMIMTGVMLALVASMTVKRVRVF